MLVVKIVVIVSPIASIFYCITHRINFWYFWQWMGNIELKIYSHTFSQWNENISRQVIRPGGKDWLIIKTERGESLIPESRLSTCSSRTLLYQTLYIQQYGQVLVFWTDKCWVRKVFDYSSCPTITTTPPTNITSSCQGMVDYVVIFNLQCVSECDNGHETQNKTQNGRFFKPVHIFMSCTDV